MLEVATARLDDVVQATNPIGVCKIDVEGHELNVLKGAARLLSERRMRDIIFEDFGQYPSAVHQLLLDSGFSIFSIHSGLLGLRLVPGVQRAAFKKVRDGQNFLATLEPKRALQRFEAIGWKSLRRGGAAWEVPE